ncbi:MAG: pyrroline-5-carboxylate reductase [Candidatus Latescibacteria bacterium]|nr:pyrroline-5-carboxylate reductase [Candidatus Latescibacterota bacterium]
MKNKKIAVIGAGNMGGALMTGWMRSGQIAAENITAVDLVPELLEQRKSELGIQVASDARDVVADQDVVVMGVKPQYWKATVSNFKDLLHKDQLVISFMAGVQIGALEAEMGALPVVRVMPNILAQVSAAGSGVCAGTHADEGHLQLVLDLLNTVGAAVVVSEIQMDAVTGLAGSGPAYVYAIIDALADGGVRAGLPKDMALTLATQTVLGAARMVAESGEHPAVLKDRVTSAGGTTIAGLHALEKGGLRAALMDAVLAATERSEALGK